MVVAADTEDREATVLVVREATEASREATPAVADTPAVVVTTVDRTVEAKVVSYRVYPS